MSVDPCCLDPCLCLCNTGITVAQCTLGILMWLLIILYLFSDWLTPIIWACTFRGFWTSNLAKSDNYKYRETLSNHKVENYWERRKGQCLSWSCSPWLTCADTTQKWSKQSFANCCIYWSSRLLRSLGTLALWSNHLPSQCVFTGLYTVKSKGILCFLHSIIKDPSVSLLFSTPQSLFSSIFTQNLSVKILLLSLHLQHSSLTPLPG